MHPQNQDHQSVSGAVTAGLMALSLFALPGCSTPSSRNPPSLNPDPPGLEYIDRGHGVHFIPTANGEKASRALAEILDKNPDKSLTHFERTGRHDGFNSAEGAGFIVILEDSGQTREK